MNLIQIKRAVRALSLGQLRKLDSWLHELIRRAEEADSSKHPSALKQTVEEQTLDNKTYRLEKIRCGKDNCNCTRGKLHGPYWYSYNRTKDKVNSQYIGKKLPKAVEKKRLSRSSDTIRKRITQSK